MTISMLYGLGLRPQELFGATFRQASRGRFRVAQVLTKAMGPAGSAKPVGRIIAAAKTADGVRTMSMRSWLHEELREWRSRLVAEGFPVGDDDFIIPGTAPDGHYTLEQQHNFIRDIKACGRVTAARDPDLSFLQKVTPYSLRRGHISLRVLAGEDIKRIADDCGTSTAMIHRHYLYELDVRHELPDDFSFDGPWRPPGAACVTCAWPERWGARRGRRAGDPPRGARSPCAARVTLGCAWTRCSDRCSPAGTGAAVAKSSPRPVSDLYGRLASLRSGCACDTNLQVFCPLSSAGRALPW